MKVLFEITKSGLKLQNQFVSYFDNLTENKNTISAITKDTEECLNFLNENKIYNNIFTHKYFDFKNLFTILKKSLSIKLNLFTSLSFTHLLLSNLPYPFLKFFIPILLLNGR